MTSTCRPHVKSPLNVRRPVHFTCTRRVPLIESCACDSEYHSSISTSLFEHVEYLSVSYVQPFTASSGQTASHQLCILRTSCIAFSIFLLGRKESKPFSLTSIQYNVLRLVFKNLYIFTLYSYIFTYSNSHLESPLGLYTLSFDLMGHLIVYNACTYIFSIYSTKERMILQKSIFYSVLKL